jgi:hypothetical protein
MLEDDARVARREHAFLESERARVTRRAAEAPDAPDAFVAWFESLRETGPGQNDVLFSWLAERASIADVRWFLTQEVAGAGMHDPMLEPLADGQHLPSIAATVWESLALGNLMVGLARNRSYAWHSVGALGVIELTAPWRAAQVNAALRRLDVPADAHATRDVTPSHAWNREVIAPLVAQFPHAARAVAEGALMRLEAGARCFRRYRRELWQ